MDAPVDYEPRDFVLHLFAKVCTEVVGPDRVAELRGLGEPVPSVPPAKALISVPLVGGFTLMIAGTGLLFEWLPSGGELHRLGPLIGASALFFAGYALAFGSLVRSRPRLRRERLARKLAAGTRDGESAMAWLRQILFQRTVSAGWSHSFQAPFGLSSEAERGTELVDRQMTFPEIVDSFRTFLKQISQTRQVRIGIDELDKMDDQTARRFLNEIKVVFRVPGCFFLISISEDAMSNFERRGLPVRDVFDSTFDDVIYVPYLNFEGSRALLARRIIGLPLPFVALLHCLSSGLPRDLIRAARELVDLRPGTSFERASLVLSQRVLQRKLNGARIAARSFDSEPEVRVLIEWLDHLEDSQRSAAALFEACSDAHEKFTLPLMSQRKGAESNGETDRIRALGLQLTSSAYLAVTHREFFSRFDHKVFVDYAQRIEDDQSRVDWLAGIPQAMAEDLATGWSDLSLLRFDCGLKIADFPSSPVAVVI